MSAAASGSSAGLVMVPAGAIGPTKLGSTVIAELFALESAEAEPLLVEALTFTSNSGAVPSESAPVSEPATLLVSVTLWVAVSVTVAAASWSASSALVDLPSSVAPVEEELLGAPDGGACGLTVVISVSEESLSRFTVIFPCSSGGTGMSGSSGMSRFSSGFGSVVMPLEALDVPPMSLPNWSSVSLSVGITTNSYPGPRTGLLG